MYRIVVLAALAAIVAGCGAAPARPDAGAANFAAASVPVDPAETIAEKSPKKPKLSCVQ
jgi:hypothetical protein